jgi:hypothetical protein
MDALAGVLAEVGWVQDVIVNKASGFVVDGQGNTSCGVVCVVTGRQFSSVQLGLSSCVFGLVQFATRAFRAAGMAYVLSRCCPATRILLLKIRDSLARGNPMLADRSAIRDLSCPRIPTSQEDVSPCLNPRYADHITTIL